jgi:hypothetical protein
MGTRLAGSTPVISTQRTHAQWAQKGRLHCWSGSAYIRPFSNAMPLHKNRSSCNVCIVWQVELGMRSQEGYK